MNPEVVGEASFKGVGGLGIFVRAWRPGLERPRGVVVISHGFNSHSGYYDWTARQLNAAGMAVYAVDLRGRGKSDGERFYVQSFDEYVSDVHTVTTHARAAHPALPVFVLGHSAGGVVSCRYALEHQAELAGLICESFAFQVPAPDFALAVFKGLAHVFPHAHAIGHDGYFVPGTTALASIARVVAGVHGGAVPAPNAARIAGPVAVTR